MEQRERGREPVVLSALGFPLKGYVRNPSLLFLLQDGRPLHQMIDLIPAQGDDINQIPLHSSPPTFRENPIQGLDEHPASPGVSRPGILPAGRLAWLSGRG